MGVGSILMLEATIILRFFSIDACYFECPWFLECLKLKFISGSYLARVQDRDQLPREAIGKAQERSIVMGICKDSKRCLTSKSNLWTLLKTSLQALSREIYKSPRMKRLKDGAHHKEVMPIIPRRENKLHKWFFLKGGARPCINKPSGKIQARREQETSQTQEEAISPRGHPRTRP